MREDRIEAREIILSDENGVARIRLSAEIDGGMITLIGKPGDAETQTSKIQLSAEPDGATSLLMRSPHGELQVSAGALGISMLLTNAEKGRVIVSLLENEPSVTIGFPSPSGPDIVLEARPDGGYRAVVVKDGTAKLIAPGSSDS